MREQKCGCRLLGNGKSKASSNNVFKFAHVVRWGASKSGAPLSRVAMTYEQLAYLHLGSVVPAFVIGTFLLARPKGTRVHKALGRIYLMLMLATGVTTLFMPARVGPAFLGHFGFIHIFSLVALYCAPAAYLAARSGNIRTHRGNMIGLYVGGILIAGAFAFSPGRMLNEWIFGPSVHPGGTSSASAELRR